jgi:hypothetical protein
MTRRLALTLSAGVLLAASALAQTAASAAQTQTAATSTRAATAAHVHTWPRHVYAPYFETWTTDSIPQVAAESGARYFSLGFIQTASAGSCTLTWDGDSTLPIPGPHYQDQIAQIHQMGGDVAPTFGGYSADTTNTEIADSCTDVGKIAADYESLITTYRITRLDMDIEADSLNNAAGIDRRNKAIAEVEAWARNRHWPLQVEYTLPVEPTGLEPNALAAIQNAIDNNARISVVNIMTFDYYLASEPSPLDMAAEAISAARNAHSQLAALYPDLSQARLWALEGMTLMPGIDDYPGKTEITYLRDAAQVLGFARAHGLAVLSIWAIQRDNGGCPGTIGANGCSGITQPPWAFSHLLEPFTGWF